MKPASTRLLPAVAILLCLGLSACVGTIVGTAVDVGIEVVKIPFKVGGAVVDVVTDDDDDDDSEEELEGSDTEYEG